MNMLLVTESYIIIIVCDRHGSGKGRHVPLVPLASTTYEYAITVKEARVCACGISFSIGRGRH